jgi:hypothetical protein
MVKIPERRLVRLSIDLDTMKKTVHLVSSGVLWLDSNKNPDGHGGKDFELEILLPGGRSLRAPLSSFETTLDEPFSSMGKITKGRVNCAVYTDEDGIGYRVWDLKTKELLGEEKLPAPKTPPKIEISGGPAQDLRVRVDRKVTSIVTLWSTDQGQTWQPIAASGTTGEVAIPSRILPSESKVRTGGMLVEVRVMVGLKLYKERYQFDATEKAVAAGNWIRLQGEHSPIPQRALITTTQREEK